MSGNPDCSSTSASRKITVGLTYDLRDDYLREGYSLEETAEFDKPDTIAAIENVILKNGYLTDRIGHIQALTRRLAAGDRWDLVFNIAEGLHGFGREAQVPALLDALQNSLHLFRSARTGPDASQRHDQTCRARSGHSHPGLCRCFRSGGYRPRLPSLSPFCQTRRGRHGQRYHRPVQN